MDHLKQVIAKDNCARRCRQILADLEIIRIGHADIAGEHILHHVLNTSPQALAARLDKLLQGNRVRPQVVRRRHGIQPLPPPECRPPTLTIG